MPSSRRRICRHAALALVLGAGCSGRQTGTDTSDATASPSADGSGETASIEPTTDSAETGTPTRTSLVLHDVDRDDLPHRSRVGVLSPDVWEWVTTAAETGAVDIGTEEGWTPAFPTRRGTETSTPTSQTSTPTGPASPEVDLALAAADVLVVDGERYAPRLVYAGESYYAVEGVPVESVPAADDSRSVGEVRVANVSDLPPAQRRVAVAAIENERGYEVGTHERRSEAFEAVRAYDYFRYRNRSYRRYFAQGDTFHVHTTLWADPVETVDEDDVVFAVEPVDLSARGREIVATAVADDAGAATVESMPPALVDAVETNDFLATTTRLYRPRLLR
ncbi:hypothetical protein [Salinigranum salinum]|uniref:hypothetical protein n=1 Tax=Salinigranum salinum TaxID=1364937 RepID=UPI001260BBE8|nr:hypothetical protein [Salinigranum salinum]